MDILIILTFPIINYFMASWNDRDGSSWFILGIFTQFFSTALLYYLGHKYKNWLSVDQYISKHPNSNSGSGISCLKCGSKSIRNTRINKADNLRRLHYCNSCGEQLYYSGFNT